jgi:hypothetical protein
MICCSGFVQEGVMRRSRFCDGRWGDVIFMGILKEAFLQERQGKQVHEYWAHCFEYKRLGFRLSCRAIGDLLMERDGQSIDISAKNLPASARNV